MRHLVEDCDRLQVCLGSFLSYSELVRWLKCRVPRGQQQCRRSWRTACATWWRTATACRCALYPFLQ